MKNIIKNKQGKGNGFWLGGILGVITYAGLIYFINSSCGIDATCVSNNSWIKLPASLFITPRNSSPIPDFGSGILMIAINAIAYFIGGVIVKKTLFK